jgi:phage FluMu protein Com
MKTCSPSADCRCLCGCLLARIVASGVELKCRRCKRTLLVALQEHARLPEAPVVQGASVHAENT